MKERPILFSAPMVRAILAGNKTQTRRVVKPQPYVDRQGNFCWNGLNFGQDFNGPHVQAIASPIPSSKTKRVHCPFGQPGDRLWVREKWNWFDPAEIPLERFSKRAPFTGCQGPRSIEWCAVYEADGDLYHPTDGAKALWKSPFHMPRWASRILLDVASVRVERLHEISEADAIAEGLALITKDGSLFKYGIPDLDGLPGNDNQGWHWHEWERDPRKAYRKLWESINGEESWTDNPWVWVIEFRRCAQ